MGQAPHRSPSFGQVIKNHKIENAALNAAFLFLGLFVTLCLRSWWSKVRRRKGRDTKSCVSTGSGLVINNPPLTNITNLWNRVYMDDLYFRNKYRVTTARLRVWDYAHAGIYFITVCTKYRFPWFGELNDGTMQLSPIGNAVERAIAEIPHHFPFVSVDEFTVMPDHVHALIRINDLKRGVETQDFVSLREGAFKNVFGPQSKNIPSIVRGFKIGVTKYARENGNFDFVWQPGYHDMIIHDDDELNAVRQYIRNNRLKNTSFKIPNPIKNRLRINGCF